MIMLVEIRQVHVYQPGNNWITVSETLIDIFSPFSR